MSQLQRDTTCRQPRPGQDQNAGSGCCPEGDGPEREAGRSPGTVLSTHGGSWAAATGPGEASGGGRKGTGPGPRYSQEVAAHSGGDQHRDDHPAETPALARQGPAPEPPTAVPPEPPLTRGSAPWARTRGRRCPPGPRRRKRGRAAARSCAPSWPLRTGLRPAHCRATQPIRGRSAPRWRHRRLPLADPLGPARPRIPPHVAPQRSTRAHTAASQNPLCYRARTHTHRRLPRQPAWAHIPLRTQGSGAGPPLHPAVRLPGRALPPLRYLGTLRSSLMSHSAMLSRAREPDWCVAARGVGT